MLISDHGAQIEAIVQIFLQINVIKLLNLSQVLSCAGGNTTEDQTSSSDWRASTWFQTWTTWSSSSIFREAANCLELQSLSGTTKAPRGIRCGGWTTNVTMTPAPALILTNSICVVLLYCDDTRMI